MAPAPSADPAKAQAELVHLKQQIVWAEQAIQTLMAGVTNQSRERAYKLSERIFGLLGILRFSTEEIAVYTQKDSDASLDSDLSLLWWDNDFYRTAGRLANPFYYWHSRPRGREAAPSVPMLMVSRLDGPTPDLASQLVDRAVAAERAGGPQGKVYIDARGTKPQPGDVYGFYDQNLRDLALLIKTQTRYEVILEDTDRRFSRPGEAPDVILDAGWYKLRSYEDAFTFRPGAVGYHIASGEAISLHDPAEAGWCKNALERGITATLGSTGKPGILTPSPPLNSSLDYCSRAASVSLKRTMSRQSMRAGEWFSSAIHSTIPGREEAATRDRGSIRFRSRWSDCCTTPPIGASIRRSGGSRPSLPPAARNGSY